jgi:beta-galactosidase
MTEMSSSKWPLSGFARGTDWNPDQWPKEVWLRDIELMVDAKVNLVSFPVFGWALLETSEGVFDFAWLDELMDQLEANGIGADLATATATPPAWMVRKYNDILPVDFDGVKLDYGSRQSYCPNSESYRAGILRLVSKMAERYKNHPALKMWHISNEYGDHISRCYCNNCELAFRTWLVAKYETIENVNNAWGTKMWGQLYSNFSEINPPRKTMAPGNPSHTLDYARFATDSLTELLVLEKQLLESMSPDKPLLTNFMTLLTDVDYWKLSEHIDYVTFDNYPDPADPFAQNTAALNYGVMRSLAKRMPWMLLESATSAVSWRAHNAPKPDGLNRLHAFQAVANGSDAVMYFQWRASLVGAERFHSAVVGHFGEQSRTYVETKQIWHELDALAQIVGSKVRSSVAFLLDWESRWSMYGPETMPSEKLVWIDQMREYHKALLSLGVTVNSVHPEADLSDYDLVIAPSAFMLSGLASENIARYVKDGGHLLFGPFSGVVDENNHVPRNGFLGDLSKVFGVQIEEYWPAVGPVEVKLASGGKAVARNWTELIHSDQETKVIATYSDGPLSGRPAATRHKFGQGEASYVSFDAEAAGLVEIIRGALTSASISQRVQENISVESVVRTNGSSDFVFVLNHGDKSASVAVPGNADVLLSDSKPSSDGSYSLAPFEVLIYKCPSNNESLKLNQVIEVK